MAMDKSAADAYVYSKASGMLAKSFAGPRVEQLFNAKSLSELWNMISDRDIPSVPETLLAKALENEAQRVFIDDYKRLISNYEKPDAILISLLHFYDYDNMKEIGAALCMGEDEIPSVVDTTPYNIVDYSKWPDLALMTKDGPLSWYNNIPQLKEQQDYDYRLDCQYISEIWNAISKMDSSCKQAVMDLVGENYRMINLLWALRLKLYYNMPDELIMEHLAYSKDPATLSAAEKIKDPLAKDAIKILEWDLDNYDDWSKWKYKRFLNPHEEGVIWTVDPRWITNAFRKYHVNKAYKLFHLYPFTPCPLICYFIVKREELDNIRTASESLRLHIASTEAMQLSGIQEM